MVSFNTRFSFVAILVFVFSSAFSQLVINEGSNKNFSVLPDEDSEYPDWIEIYNAGNTTVNMNNYSLTDDSTNITKWTFPNINIAAHEYKPVFCSGKDRKPISGFVNVLNTGSFTPVGGWNNHHFTTPFYWDGVSSIVINTCSFSSNGYTVNSVFNQSATSYPSSNVAFQDGSPASCSAPTGNLSWQRPNMKINGHQIGFGNIQNCNTCYPAPYGNWYWGARNQMIIPGAELIAAGVTAGMITDLAFDIVSPDPAVYDYIDINMKMVSYNQLSSYFEPINPYNYQHTNFTISTNGEKIFLYDNNQNLLSSLMVSVQAADNSNGSLPDASTNIALFSAATPSATNNGSTPYSGYALPPTFSVNSGIQTVAFNVTISNPNSGATAIHYTLDGSDPTISSPLYNASAIHITQSTILKARAFVTGLIPSSMATASYLFNVNSMVPVLSVVTDPNNLYGGNGIFDNWWTDWQKQAYAEYFDTAHQLIFSQPSGIQMDGGAGGSRSQPQHSFRLELNNSVLGGGTVQYPFIPNHADRLSYSNFYLRNGSNQFLTLPYKDAALTEITCAATHCYYSAWRPVTVYMNGQYFGLYELREKFDTELFKSLEQANPDSTSILSLSYWYGSTLRSLCGSVDTFWNNYFSFNNLNTNDTAYWTHADHYFDLTYYTDYIISESWAGNVDWPGNNIKIYRSDKTNYRWRFATVDLELSLAPNGWTDCYYDHIAYMMSQGSGNPYINIWNKSIQNNRYHDFFINRFADVMNTAYLAQRVTDIENSMYNQTVGEMNDEYMKWGDPQNIPGQMNSFYQNHIAFRNQLLQRSAQVRDHIQNNFGLPKQVNVTLDVYPAGAGTIHISTITPDTYPWTGVYFDGVPVKIEAIPEPGYHFLNWNNNNLIADTLNAIFLDTITLSNINFTANFIQNGLGVPTTAVQPMFSLFPSPATTQLFLINNVATQAQSIEVTDVTGKMVLTAPLNSNEKETQINIQNLADGIYLLRVMNQMETIQQFQFVKLNQ